MPKASFLLGLEPKEAIEYLHQKKLLASKVFKKELYDSALARATTISKLTDLDITRDIYGSMEKARREGKSFNEWKKTLVGDLERKGWVYGHDKAISRGIDGKLLADPKTGEHFGTPRRLNTIYRTNMQQAYSAARYQRYMDNVDNRPYWQYSAVGDKRTRPAHQALNGKIYRYDDPFWATFYPPNGFNCRCTVIALSERDLKRKGIEQVGSSEALLVKAKRPKDKLGNQEETIGFKLPDGTVRVADKGFDYNVGRLSYKPNLDLYPEKLAHQFAKAEMVGGEFKLSYEKLARKVSEIKGDKGKLTAEEMVRMRDHLTQNFKFAAGRLNLETQKQIGSKVATVWLSDDTLIKQFNSREGQDFGLSDYANLPDVFNSPLKIELDEREGWRFYAELNGKRYFAVIKVLAQYNEIFVQSFRLVSDKQWEKVFN
ncbi:phage minor head protein [Glaesserella parasuis]|uniref:phage minor head protein n=1 Tax=Glaesserella parasuis TaxID=738 RepID=UPI002367CC55|nr:phage minor head protein [Glaesserella parasuis]MDG6478414.1 phage minor head protein [Glaesserella parasuis]MDO9853554.1 phage minor head protein [Glaesserella parasuis]MDO9948284.1 phage minor head protein [Glaesserella parasuis]MDO9997292.1 phage minor head protein [Glaesserella parasuis]MDP0045891.1 phage minor head protein [Glaesserella parasuis]